MRHNTSQHLISIHPCMHIHEMLAVPWKAAMSVVVSIKVCGFLYIRRDTSSGWVELDNEELQLLLLFRFCCFFMLLLFLQKRETARLAVKFALSLSFSFLQLDNPSLKSLKSVSPSQRTYCTLHTRTVEGLLLVFLWRGVCTQRLPETHPEATTLLDQMHLRLTNALLAEWNVVCVRAHSVGSDQVQTATVLRSRVG